MTPSLKLGVIDSKTASLLSSMVAILVVTFSTIRSSRCSLVSSSSAKLALVLHRRGRHVRDLG